MSILYEYEPDDLSSQTPVPSPCIGVCKMDAASGWCSGCFRNLDELRGWSTASDEHKRVIWREVKLRMFADIA